MSLRLSKEINQILSFSRDEAIRTGCYKIDTDHIILGIIRHYENRAYTLLESFNIDIDALKNAINASYTENSIIPFEKASEISFSPNVEAVLREMVISARIHHFTTPDASHLLLAIIHCSNSEAVTFLKSSGMSEEAVLGKLRSHNSPTEKEGNNTSTPLKKEGKKDGTNPLSLYGIDLTKSASDGKLDPVVGRDAEIDRLAQILCRRRKNNPILIGEPGVGKSAIVEGLAARIASKKISRALVDKRIISLDIGSIVAGTKYRGQFEERIKSIINQIKEDSNIILFIDEIHTIVGAGGASGSLDAANLLKPALSRGEIHCIGATTLDEFREVVEKDGALERRFQKIMIEPSTFEETYNILNGIKPKYEQHHKVIYSDEAIRACISLSNRYLTDRCLPDKAIDAMDEAGARALVGNLSIPKNILKLEHTLTDLKVQKKNAVKDEDFILACKIHEQEKEVKQKYCELLKEWGDKEENSPIQITAEDIASVISMMTGVPAYRIAMTESQKLLSMGDTLKRKIIGQDEAIDKVAKAVRRNRAGLSNPNKPIGTFLFLGPTGVGKTQLAKEIAKFLFDSQDSIIRIDMSEYMEKHSISRLIGAPPGYIGYKEGGQLSERVRRKPYSVVLLDEIEKAHPDIFNILLQVLDEGRLTDSNGNYIDFRNTILILTSNVGSRELKDFGTGIGYITTSLVDQEKKNKAIVEKAIDRTFNPEFINRLDEQIFFNPLTMEDIEKIIDIELQDLYERVANAGYKLTLKKSAKKFIAQSGYDPQYGARPLKRAIQHLVEDLVAEAILSDSISIGGTIALGLNKKRDELIILK